MSEASQEGCKALPDEILLVIFKSLPRRDVKSCALVCHQWRRVAYDKCFGLWESQYITDRCRGRTLPLDTIVIALSNGMDILNLRQCKIADSVLRDIDLGGFLRYVVLCMIEISAESLLYLIRDNPKLINVTLEEIETVDFDVCRAIGTLENLDELLIMDCKNIKKNELEALSPAFKRVSHLQIRQIPIGEEEMDVLTASLNPAMNTLRIGSVEGALRDKNVFQILSTCSELELLFFWNTIKLSNEARTAILASDIKITLFDVVELPEELYKKEERSRFKKYMRFKSRWKRK